MAGLTPSPRQKRSPRTDSESILKFVPTMQPTMVVEPPAGPGWLHEIKYDGYRSQIIIEGPSVRAFTRNGHDWTAKYGPIIQSARSLLCKSAIIDGEICVQDEAGVTDFGALPAAMAKDPRRLVMFAFDLLHLDGEDLRKAPLEERRAKLRYLVSGSPGRIQISDEYDGDGPAFFKAADQLGLEGIVSKRKGSRYVSGKTTAWLKVKCWHVDTFDVIGVERDAAGIPYALLADAEGYRGAAFVTLPAALREAFWRYVEARGVPTAPISGMRRKGALWISPGLKASVRHLKGSDKLRHATVQSIEVEE